MIHLCTISRTERKSHAEAAVPTTYVHPSAQCVRVKRVRRSWEYNACSIEHVQYEYKYGSSWQRSISRSDDRLFDALLPFPPFNCLIPTVWLWRRRCCPVLNRIVCSMRLSNVGESI